VRRARVARARPTKHPSLYVCLFSLGLRELRLFITDFLAVQS
jgi:hypothetical protein